LGAGLNIFATMRKKAKYRFQDLPKEYAALCRVFLPRPIRDAVDFANVVEMADAMVLWEEEYSRDQSDYFDLLCSLIEEYEAKHVPPPKGTGVEMLRHLMDANDMKQADLARLLGVHRTLGGMILRGERKLTLKHVRTLAKRFKVSADLFLG